MEFGLGNWILGSGYVKQTPFRRLDCELSITYWAMETKVGKLLNVNESGLSLSY